MKFSIVAGSHRKDSQSAKVGRYVERSLRNISSTHQTFFLDLGTTPLPYWDEGANHRKAFAPISAELSSSDGLVVISPEWSGMCPPQLKNFFLLCGPTELAHKPGMIIGVSAGRSGTYPVSELRSSSYKNTRICYVPDHVIIRSVNDVLNEPEPVDEGDRLTRERIDYSLAVLGQYALALKQVRDSSVVDTKKFPNGM